MKHILIDLLQSNVHTLQPSHPFSSFKGTSFPLEQYCDSFLLREDIYTLIFYHQLGFSIFENSSFEDSRRCSFVRRFKATTILVLQLYLQVFVENAAVKMREERSNEFRIPSGIG
jgi:hypothetical protein